MNTNELSRGLGFFSLALGLAELFAPRQVAHLIGVQDEHETLLRALGGREVASGISLIAQPGEAGWLWSRVAGDMMDLSLLWVAFSSPRNDRRRLAGALTFVTVVGAADAIATAAALRPPRVDPSWRYTPPGGRAGIDRRAVARPGAKSRSPDELVDRPLASAGR